MGDGMKFNIDELDNIIRALDEMKGCHCYNHYEDDYEWEQSFEKRWADEINRLIKRFEKYANTQVQKKCKEMSQERNANIYKRLKDSGLYEDML